MKAIILAAGKGKRLNSEASQIPKCLRNADGRTLLEYARESASFIEDKDITIVVGYMSEAVREHMGESYSYALQSEQLGTGHAVACAKDNFKDFDGEVLILLGDMPLLTEQTVLTLIEQHRASKNDATILTCTTNDKMAFGRIIRDKDGGFCDIVEEKDCTPEQREIKELNVSVYVFDSKKLFESLKELKSSNSQGEYYLTDVPKIMLSKGYKVGAVTTYNVKEVLGVNTCEELAVVEAILNAKKIQVK